MAVITSGKGQSAHWYHRDGTPQHTVPLAKGDGERPTHLGDARKLGLYPSVSGIIGMLAKPGLDNWKLKQMVDFALRTPRTEGVSDAHYFAMVKDAAFEQVDVAADFGTGFHDEVYKFLRWDFAAQPQYPISIAYEDYVRPTINWMLKNGIKILDPEKVLVNHQHGFAGTSDAPYRATKSFGILDYKTKKTKPGKPIDEYPEKILQLAAYFATYWGEASLDNPQAWAGNIYISSTERGRTSAIMYNHEAIKRAWEVFKVLCLIWRDRNEYDPRLTVTTQPKYAAPIVIEIAPPIANPTVGNTTAELAGVVAQPVTTAQSPESVNVPPLPIPPSSPNLLSGNGVDADPTIAILTATAVDRNVDGVLFLSPLDCKNWKKDSIPTIYAWWYDPANNAARVGIQNDMALSEHGWKRCFRAYAANLDHENRAAGKADPVVGTNNLPVKPPVGVVPPGPKITKDDLAKGVVKPDVAAAPAGSPERIAQLERMKVGFGKHRNDTLVAVPTSYFTWCLGEMARGTFKGTPHVQEYLSIPSVIEALDLEAGA